jgi:hypothetical protein
MNDAPDEATAEGPGPIPSIEVHYWVGEGELPGVEEFRHELATSYTSAKVMGEQGGLGGGLYTLFVDVITSVTLAGVVKLILDGVAFDLIKLGARNFVLRPLLAAQRKLRNKNPRGNDGDIARLTLLFNDSIVVIDADSRVDQNIADSIGELLRLVACHHTHLALATGESPIEIYVPVIEDKGENPVARFRAVLDVDEEMRISKSVFFEYWGLTYRSGELRVYDVGRQLLIDEPYIKREVYWERMEDRWRQERRLP